MVSQDGDEGFVYLSTLKLLFGIIYHYDYILYSYAVSVTNIPTCIQYMYKFAEYRLKKKEKVTYLPMFCLKITLNLSHISQSFKIDF